MNTPVQRPQRALPAAYTDAPANADSGRRALDPLRYCVFTTVALLAWLVGPPAVVAAMSVLGLVAYGRAVRGGLTESRCVLRRPGLILAYLAAALACALAALARPLYDLLAR
jgi:hypothetical protein